MGLILSDNGNLREALKKKTLKVVEVSTRGGGRPHFHKKKMKKKCFFKEIFNLVQNGLVHPKMQR